MGKVLQFSSVSSKVAIPDDLEDLLGGTPASALDTPIAFSTFKAADRPTPTERTLTLRQIAEMVRSTTITATIAATTEHPLLKLALFNGKRNADNMRLVTGVEIDHDDGDIGPDEALEALQDAGVAALIYTTRKDVPEQRRWRALLPFSRPLIPSQRRQMAEAALRLLGVDNDDAGVSTAEGTAFYYAGVDGKPRFVETCPGRFLDLVCPPADPELDDLLGTAPGDDTLDELDDLAAEAEAHARLRDFEDAVETGKLASALAGIPLETMERGSIRPTVIEVGFALHHASGGSEAGLALMAGVRQPQPVVCRTARHRAVTDRAGPPAVPRVASHAAGAPQGHLARHRLPPGGATRVEPRQHGAG